MSKYTTEVRFICETANNQSDSSGGNSVNEVITNALPHIFNFDFPIFDEEYRPILERKILKHYYTREIGEETVGLWKLRLDTRLNEIMPYYNKLYSSELIEFNPLYSSNIQRTRKTDLDSKRNEDESVNDTTNNSRTTGNTSVVERESDGTQNTTNNGTSRDLYSDTPQGALTNVENETYLTNARKVIDNTQGVNTTHNTGNMKTVDSGTDNSNGTYGRLRGVSDNILSTEDYLENVVGYDGKDPSEMILKFRKTFLNIDKMIIDDLEDLFFQLW